MTTSRADYSHLYWPLRAIQAHSSLSLDLLVSGAHLSPRYGHTIDEIRDDEMPVSAQIECLLSSDSDVGMAKTIGTATLGFADALDRLRPDVLLLIADRYEMLAPATAAVALRIPIAHIEGGEISAGAVDDAIRHALTKLSHTHFTPTETASRRVVSMGEEAWRVHRTGAPSLDHLFHRPRLPAEVLREQLGISSTGAITVVAMHPVTLAEDPVQEAREVLAALELIDGNIVFCFPNADTGNYAIVEMARSFCEAANGRHLFVNLSADRYFNLLAAADLMLGNSSSGIMETASFELPTVNVGMRQEGRERASNVLDAEPTAKAIGAVIRQALSADFRASLAGMKNPYGAGNAGEKIADVLANLPDRQTLLHKQHPDV